MLQTLGVPELVELVYRALLRDATLSGETLAEEIGSTPEDAEDAMAQLVTLGMAEREPATGQVSPLPPDHVVATLVAREEEAIAQRKKALASSQQNIGDLVDAFVDNRRVMGGHDLLEEIDLARVVRSRLFQLAADAKVQSCTMVPGDAFGPQATESARRLDLDLLARGVAVRHIVTELSLAAPHWRVYLDDLVQAGGEVRVHPAPPMLLVLIDESVSIPREGKGGGAYILHGRELTATARNLFEEIWNQSPRYVPDAPGQPDPQVTEARVRQVVVLLGQGHKDDAIARRMGVSVRTVRRLVSAAIDALQAQSRFQAGVNAAQMGWISDVRRGSEPADLDA